MIGASNGEDKLGAKTAGVDDVEIMCPAAQAASTRFAASVPVWRYRFHGGSSGGRAAVESEMVQQNAWAVFAKDPDRGLLSLGWPTYDPESKFWRMLGLDGGLVYGGFR
jgi:hypothetical protein